MIALVVVCSVLAALVPDQVDGFWFPKDLPYALPISRNSTGREYHWGEKRPGDRLLYHTMVRQSFDIVRRYCKNLSSPSVRFGFSGKTTVDIDLPPYGRSPIGIIRYIEVLDTTDSRSGGYVCIGRGGIGQPYVTLHFESSFNLEMKYTVNVYGY